MGTISPSLASCMISSWSGSLSSGGAILSSSTVVSLVTLGGAALAFPFAKTGAVGAAPCGVSEDADREVILRSVLCDWATPRLPPFAVYCGCS